MHFNGTGKQMNRLWTSAATILMTLGTSGSAVAGYDCKSSISEYRSALNDISSYLTRYSNCLEYSRGKDDCSTEFRRLKYAQDSFESAVSGISLYCEY